MAFQQLKLGDRNRVINNFYLAHLNDGSKFTVQQSPVEWGDIPNILPYVRTSPPKADRPRLWVSQLGLVTNWIGLRANQPGLMAHQLGLKANQPGLRVSQPGRRSSQLDGRTGVGSFSTFY